MTPPGLTMSFYPHSGSSVLIQVGLAQASPRLRMSGGQASGCFVCPSYPFKNVDLSAEPLSYSPGRAVQRIPSCKPLLPRQTAMFCSHRHCAPCGPALRASWDGMGSVFLP